MTRIACPPCTHKNGRPRRSALLSSARLRRATPFASAYESVNSATRGVRFVFIRSAPDREPRRTAARRRCRRAIRGPARCDVEAPASQTRRRNAGSSGALVAISKARVAHRTHHGPPSGHSSRQAPRFTVALVQHPIDPALLPWRIRWIRAQRVGRDGQFAGDERLAVLRHHEHDAPALLTDFGGELAERCRRGEVQQGVGRASVPVAARDDRQRHRIRERDGADVLGPRSVAVDFERVDPLAMLVEESTQTATRARPRQCPRDPRADGSGRPASPDVRTAGRAAPSDARTPAAACAPTARRRSLRRARAAGCARQGAGTRARTAPSTRPTAARRWTPVPAHCSASGASMLS